MDGRRLEAAEAWGKHLFHRYEGEAGDARVVHVHLGLFGRYRHHRGQEPEPRGAVRLRLVGEAHTLDLIGPTCCERVTDVQAAAKMASLGPDPLRVECSAEPFVAKASRSRRAIGALLLDQSVVAGIGNVYRAELLLAHGVDPFRPSREVDVETLRALWDTAVDWLALGVHLNRIVTTTPDEVGRPYSKMRKRDRVRVYKRERCGRCNQPVMADELANRTLYWCPACQC